MRVGINGMGRIGRLSLRTALGGVYRPADDPRAGNRLDIVHVNEIKGGVAATAHLLEFDSIHGRWRNAFTVDGERAMTVGGKRIGFDFGINRRVFVAIVVTDAECVAPVQTDRANPA